jgi:hypothetical protein
MKRIICGISSVLVLAAQPAAPPQTYSFTATSNMMGPATITVNRNGSKELVRTTTEGGPSLKVLYDFQAHKVFTVDTGAKTCTTQTYTSAYAPVTQDPIGGAGEYAQRAASLKTIRREVVNGIATRHGEAPLPDGKSKYKLWLDEKFSFNVKQVLVMGSQPERPVFEMKQLSYAPSAADLFAAPTGCKVIPGSTDADATP